MPTQVGVGYSEHPKFHEAGAEAARAALEDAALTSCNLVLLFGTEKHDPERLRDGVREVVGSAPRLIGRRGYRFEGRLTYDGLLSGAALSARAMGGIRGETAHQAGLLEAPFQGVALVGAR